MGEDRIKPDQETADGPAPEPDAQPVARSVRPGGGGSRHSLAVGVAVAPGLLVLTLALSGAGAGALSVSALVVCFAAGVVAVGLTRRAGPDPAERNRLSVAEAKVEALTEGGARLRARVGELERVLDAVDGPVLVIGPDDRVLLCNDAAVRLLSVGGERVAGRVLDEVVTSTELIDLCHRARDGQTHRRRLRLRRDGVAGDFDASAAPVGVAGGPPDKAVAVVVLTLVDVTELARAVSVKTDFVANASHELRTPISAIYTAAETLEDAGPDEGELVAKLVRVVRVHAERLNELVGDLLDLSRLESAEDEVRTEAVDAERLIEDAAAPFGERMAGRSLTLDADIDSACATLRTDPKLMGLIVRNLVDNATKFGREGTEVRLRLRAEGTAAVLTVSDRGVGIPIDQQRRIFERFYQVDPARVGGGRRGTGLGLAIVKHASIALGGDVSLESVWQRGSTFTVRLPAAVKKRTENGG